MGTVTLAVGMVVQYRPDPRLPPVWGGVLEYLTSDGWAGIRDYCGGLDEVPTHLVEVDPS